MATTTAGGSVISVTASTGRAIAARSQAASSTRRRSISAQAGRGIEMLGHAIDYLADDFALECLSQEVRVETGLHPRVAAIELLKALNREIYLSCPQVPTWSERLRSWLGLRRA